MIFFDYLNLWYNICLFIAVTGLDCHQCASKDGGCRDPYDLDENDNSDGCGDMDTHCYKQKYVLKLYDSGAILGKPRGTFYPDTSTELTYGA